MTGNVTLLFLRLFRAFVISGRLATSLAAALIFSFISVSYGAEKPIRIASLNLCLDQLVLDLVPVSRVVSVTFLAADPNYSFAWRNARKVHLNRGRAEEILPLRPDLVLANRWSARPATQLLERLGYRVERFPHAADFASMRTIITRLSRILGVPERGAAMIRRFDRDLAGLAVAPGGKKPVAALYWTGGMTSGRGSLAGAILDAAGFDNLADRIGLDGTTVLGVETLLRQRYDMLIIADAREIAPSIARQSLIHPVLRRAARKRPVLTLPRRYLMCGVPQVAEAVRLVRARWADAQGR